MHNDSWETTWGKIIGWNLQARTGTKPIQSLLKFMHLSHDLIMILKASSDVSDPLRFICK